MQIRFLLLLLVFLVPAYCGRRKNRKSRPTLSPLPQTPIQLLRRVLHMYNKNDRPATDEDRPVEVQMSFHFSDVWIESGDATMSLQFDVRYEWEDSRLAFQSQLIGRDPGFITLNPSYMDMMWLPDIFFANGLYVHAIAQPVRNVMMKLNSTGHMILQQRLNTKVRCTDIIDNLFKGKDCECPLKIGTYASDEHEVMLSWLETPLTFDTGISVPGVIIHDTVKYTCSPERDTGTFPCAEIAFLLKPHIE